MADEDCGPADCCCAPAIGARTAAIHAGSGASLAGAQPGSGNRFRTIGNLVVAAIAMGARDAQSRLPDAAWSDCAGVSAAIPAIGSPAYRIAVWVGGRVVRLARVAVRCLHRSLLGQPRPAHVACDDTGGRETWLAAQHC